MDQEPAEAKRRRRRRRRKMSRRGIAFRKVQTSMIDRQRN